MGIVDEDIARVRETADIVAVVSEHVQLKRVGRRWAGLCPFHSEKSASFSVNAEQGLYYCFGCGAKGDVITFVREIDHLDFAAAVERLAAASGITLRYTDARDGENRKRRSGLIEVMAAAVDLYHQRLLEAPDAAAARRYLRSRGFTGEEVREYRIGWAPDAWDTLVRALPKKREQLVEAGLAFTNQRGSPTDAFRARVLFPIFSASGDPVAFGGRVLPGADGPKYKNSQSTPIYDKSRVLYGLNWAKADIVAADEAIVCEGYTDVIGFAAAGVPRAVATCGTALTEDHVRTLRSYASRVVLAFDADAAGQNAAERFHEWEQRHSLDVAVAALPPGTDPGDLARSDPDALRAAVEGAVPFLRFRVDRVLADRDLATAEARARAATDAVAVVAQHPDPLVRDQYVMDLADRLRLPADGLRERLATELRRPAAGRGAAGSTREPQRSRTRDAAPVDGRAQAPEADRGVAPPRGPVTLRHDSPEYEALRLAIAQPDEVAPALHEVLFADPVSLDAFRRLESSGWRAVDAIADGHPDGPVDPSVAALIQRLAVEQTGSDPADVVERLVEAAGLRALAVLGAEARTSGDERALELAGVVAWLKPLLEALRDDRTSPDAVAEVLGWLVERQEVDA